MNRDLSLVALALMSWGIGEGMFLYFEPLYLQQLGADPIVIGGILGGVGLIMSLSYLPAGYLSDRIGRRPLLLAAWVIGVAATGLMALANSLPLFVLGMALYGFTTFVVVPLNSYITHARGKMSVGRSLTLISATFNFGVIIGPLIGGWIGDTFGLQKTFSAAAFIFLVSTIVIFFISSQPVEHKDLASTGFMYQELWNRRYIQFMVMLFIVMFALFLPQPLSQNYLQNQQGLDLTQIGRLIAARSLGIVVFSLVLGQMNARIGFLLSQIFMMGFAIFLWQGAGMLWFFAGYFLLGSYNTARTLALAQGRSLFKSASMGVGYGILETAMAAAIVLAPPLAGFLYKQNPSWIYSVSLALMGIVFLISLFLSPIRSRDLPR